MNTQQQTDLRRAHAASLAAQARAKRESAEYDAAQQERAAQQQQLKKGTMTAAHTPGPWHAEFACHVDEATTDVGQGAFQILSVAGEAGGVLCSRHRWPEREEEMNANARLIAAAPEMLEVLQEIDKRLSMCATAGLSASDAYDSYFQFILESAIKKATGATP